MFSVEEDQEVDVRDGLLRHAKAVRPTGRSSWKATPRGDGAGEFHVRKMDGWLVLNAELSDAVAHLAKDAQGAWDCLRANRAFSGGAMIVFQPETGRLEAAAEILWSEDEADWEVHLAAAFQGMTQAGHWRPLEELVETAAESDASLNLAELCQTAGWPGNERADGSVAVSLESQESVLLGNGGLALVEHDAARGVIARVEMLATKDTEMTPQIRLAVARMLLKAGGLVRFARPVTWESDSRVSDSRVKAGFEVVLGSAATPGRLTAALSALSVAWQLCGREVHALAFQAIAEAFLDANRQIDGQ